MATNAERLMRIYMDNLPEGQEVDCDKVAEALGISSMQQVALLKTVNAEFGTSITAEDVLEARKKGQTIASLLPS